MKFGKNLKRVLCLTLCILMSLSVLAVFSSCDEQPEEAPKATGDINANRVQVVRVIKTIEIGEKIVRDKLQEVMIEKEYVPEGTFASISDVVNKFATVKLYSGDFLFEGKISKTPDFAVSSGPVHEDFISVTEYIVPGEKDIAKCIQKAIDENPNKTIYFPDGNYLVSRPLKTSADPAKAVSFKLSNYAYISAASSVHWEGGDAIFELGALDSDKGANYSVIGGIIGGNSVTGAFCVKGGSAFINNFSLKRTTIGIAIKEGARADVDSGVVIGATSSKDGSIGVLVEADNCTLTNMRLCDIWCGIRITGNNNVFRNLHPLYIGSDNNTSCGFWDTGSSNFFDVCYSDQLAIGFRVGPDTKSIFNGCFVMWYAGDKSAGSEKWTQYGFLFDGQMNSIVRDTVVSVSEKKPDSTYMKITEPGGNGVVLYPRLSAPSNDDYLILEGSKVVGGKGDVPYFDYVKTDFLK